MPTLVSTGSSRNNAVNDNIMHHHSAAAAVQEEPPSTVLSLSIGGVTFHLTPTTNTSEVSFRQSSGGGGGVALTLTNFSGNLQVVPATTPVNSSSDGTNNKTNVIGSNNNNNNSSPPVLTSSVRTVEEESNEPISPVTTATGTTSSSSVTPSTSGQKQQKLSFEKAATKNKKQKTSHTPSILATLKTPIGAAPRNMLVPPSSGQPTQPEQPEDYPVDDDDDCDARSDLPDAARLFSKEDDSKKNNSVKDLLNQVVNHTGSSNDSVATMMDDDDETSPSSLHVDCMPSPVSIAAPPPDLTQQTTNTSVMPEGETTFSTTGSMENEEQQGYPSPCPRWGHTMTTLQNDDSERILIYGGQSFDVEGNPIILSDVHVLDTATKTWDKPINCRGEARQWHSATYLPDRKFLVCFGGETITTSIPKKNNVATEKVVTSDSLRVLDTDIMLWYPPAVSGDIPAGRSGHTATLLPDTNELVLFGGVKGSKWLNKVNVLDTIRWIWTTPTVQGTPPKPRSYQSCTLVAGDASSNKDIKNKLVIFGGNNKSKCFNSVHVLECTTNQDHSNKWEWIHPNCQGFAPFPRTGHSATLMDDGKTICYYGGWDPNETGNAEEDNVENIFKSCFYLNTDTWTWKSGPKALPGGSGCDSMQVIDCGSKRCGHTAALQAGTGEVMVFGGRIPGEVLAGDFQRLPPCPKKEPAPSTTVDSVQGNNDETAAEAERKGGASE